MPSLGADMESGTLLEWFVKPGDAVKRGDIVAVVDTSKAEIEIEIFEDGVIDELLVAKGERVPVGTPLATDPPGPIATARRGARDRPAVRASPPLRRGGRLPRRRRCRGSSAQAPPPASAPRAPTARAPPASLAARTPDRRGEWASIWRRSPAVDPDGAITRADVEARSVARMRRAPPGRRQPEPRRAASAEPAEPPDRQAAMRDAIAALMARSKREIPHYYLQTEIDLSRALAWLHEENLSAPVTERLLPSVLLLSASRGRSSRCRS